MVKNCAHGLCRSDSRYSDRPHMQGVKFFRFPSKKWHLEKVKRWATLCRRQNYSVDNVTKDSYICSLHFVNGQPTREYPDPVIATANESNATTSNSSKPQAKNKRTKGKLKTRAGPKKNNNNVSRRKKLDTSVIVQVGSILMHPDTVSGSSDFLTQKFMATTSAGHTAISSSVSLSANPCVSSSINSSSKSSSIKPTVSTTDTCIVPTRKFYTQASTGTDPPVHKEAYTNTDAPNSDELVVFVKGKFEFTRGSVERILTYGWFLSSSVLDKNPLINFCLITNGVVQMSVHVNCDTGDYTVSVLNQLLEKTHPNFARILVSTPLRTTADIRQLLWELLRWKVCPGYGRSTIVGQATPEEHDYANTPERAQRSPQCLLVACTASARRCTPCAKKHKQDLTKSYRSSKTAKSSTRTNVSSLSTDELASLVRRQKYSLKLANMRLVSLKAAHEKVLIERRERNVRNAHPFRHLVEQCLDKLNEKPLLRLMMEEQLSVLKRGDGKSHRWHPEIIKWAAHVLQKSRPTYCALQKSEFLALPSSGTIHRQQCRALKRLEKSIDDTIAQVSGCGYAIDVPTDNAEVEMTELVPPIGTEDQVSTEPPSSEESHHNVTRLFSELQAGSSNSAESSMLDSASDSVEANWHIVSTAE